MVICQENGIISSIHVEVTVASLILVRVYASSTMLQSVNALIQVEH